MKLRSGVQGQRKWAAEAGRRGALRRGRRVGFPDGTAGTVASTAVGEKPCIERARVPSHDATGSHEWTWAHRFDARYLPR